VQSCLDRTQHLLKAFGDCVSEVDTRMKKKREELCPWNDFAVQFERALTYHQLWINPSQGWNHMLQMVETTERHCKSIDFRNELLSAKNISVMVSKLRFMPFNEEAEDLSFRQKDVQWVNDMLVSTTIDVMESDGWEEVSGEGDIKVWRRFLPADLEIAGLKVGPASKFACVKAKAIIDAPLEKVFDLFTDNSRAHEYNEYCKEIFDLEWLSEDTKITQTRTGRPWSREFVTRVHYRNMDEDTKLIVNRAEDHPLAKHAPGYTRMNMPLGGNLLKRLSSDPSKTEFTLITHVDPGGLANTKFGAMVTNRLSVESPRQFLEKLQEVSTRSNSLRGVEKEAKRGQVFRRVGIFASMAVLHALRSVTSRGRTSDSSGNHFMEEMPPPEISLA